MIFQSLHIATSGLKTQQKALDVLSHNIANANTPGYHRQNAQLTANPPELRNGIAFGRGVQLSSVVRSLDPFLSNLIADNRGQSGYWNQMTQTLQALEGIFGTLDSSNLNRALDDFFNAWQQLSNNPAGLAERMGLSAKAQTLVHQISSMYQELSKAQSNIDRQVDTEVSRVNDLIDQIAQLNGKLNANSSLGSAANDLLDQRDQLIRKLNEILPVQQLSTKGGELIIQTMQGDLLVQGSSTRHVIRTGGGGLFTAVAVDGGNPLPLASQSGGRLSALIQLRDKKVQGYMDRLNSLTSSLIFSVNSIHSSGAGLVNLNRVESTQAAANPALAVNDPAQSVPFAAQITSGTFTVHVYDAAGNPLGPTGTPISITAGVTTLNDIALALNAIPGLTATVNANGRLVLDAGTGSVSFSQDSSHFLAAYGLNTFFSGADASNIAINSNIVREPSVIAAGAIDPATSMLPKADNSIASQIFSLTGNPSLLTSAGGTTIFQESEKLFTAYGEDLANARIQKDYAKAQADVLKARESESSGVNVDEEMVKMLQFQRAYQASAKVIQATNQMLDSLMRLVG